MMSTISVAEVLEDFDLEVGQTRDRLLTFSRVTSHGLPEKIDTLAETYESEPFPLTPVQHELCTALGDSPASWLSLPFDNLSEDASLDGIALTWQALASQNPILRTEFVKEGANFKQAILRKAAPISVAEDSEDSVKPSTPYLELSTTGSPRTLTLHVHPALIDQTSFRYLVGDFISFFNGYAIPRRPQLQDYINAVIDKDVAQASTYWQTKFEGSTFQTSRNPSGTKARLSLAAGFEIKPLLDDFEISTGLPSSVAVYAAWAVTISRHGGSEEALFTITQRDSGTSLKDGVVGPMDTRVPLLVRVDEESTCSDFIQRIHRDATEAGNYGFLGRKRILELVPESVKVATCIRLTYFADDTFESQASDGINVNICVPKSTVYLEADASAQHSELAVILDHFWQILKQITTSSNALVRDLDMVSDLERKNILDMGAPARTQIQPQLLHDMIRLQSQNRPDEPAIQFESGSAITYGELNTKASKLAQHLYGRVEPGSVVAMHADVSCEMIVGLLAIVKAGAAYVILDPSLPSDRKAYMLSDTSASVCIVSTKTFQGAENWAQDEQEFMFLEELWASDLSSGNPYFQGISVDAESPAYIVYTSGSTGKPKGAVLSHRAVSSGILCAQDDGSARRLLFYNPIFSAAQRTIWSTLAHGGCLCLASPSSLMTSLSQTIAAMNVTDLGITSSTIGLLDPKSVPTLKRVTMTGEAVSKDVQSLWSQHVELRNNYGLTECTQLNWGVQLSAVTVDPRNIGKPRDTTGSIILIPGTTRIAPLLVPGELCLYGPQLASLYLNKPEQTNGSFVKHPYLQGTRLYRTGDVAVRLPDGSVSIRGRADDQVKINGQRIEPREIELAICEQDHVAAAFVTAATIEERKTLVAFVQKHDSIEWPVLISSLRELALRKLPVYMVPTYWIELDTVPLNQNGKTDILALRKMVQDKTHAELVAASLLEQAHESQEELTDAEVALQSAVSSVMGLPLVLINTKSSFLELGGDSLKAIQTVSTLLESGYVALVRDVLISATLREAAEKMEAVQGSARLLVPEPFSLLRATDVVDREVLEDAYPATALQESVISAQLASGTYVYDRIFNVTGADLDQLRRAFAAVIARNPIYRTSFIENGTSLTQLVHRKFELPWAVKSDTSLEVYMQTPKSEVRDLKDPFISATLLADNVLVISMHHALFDFWSSSFLFDDVNLAYASKPIPVRVPFSFFAHYTQSLDAEAAQQFWASYLDSAQPTSLGKEADDFNVARKVISKSLKTVSSNTGVSLGAFAYAAWAVILWKHTGSTDVTFAVTLSGRDAPIPNVQTLNGPTLVTVPMRLQLDLNNSFVEFAQHVQNELWRVAEFSQYGMRNALLASNSSAALFDSMVNFLVRPGKPSSTDVLQPHGERPTWETGYKSFEVEELESGDLELKFSGRFEARRTEFIVGQLGTVLENASQNGSEPLKDINILAESELTFLNSLAACGEGVYALLQEPFEEIAASPDQPYAIEFKNERPVTYSELNSRANQLARFLREQGIGPDDLIPICLSKSVEQILAILAVLKAGGAFVPLDPDNPPERNNFIVQDVSAKLVLTDENFAPMFESSSSDVRVLDVFELDYSPFADSNLRHTGTTPENLAYAIYTSGSTGTPKGVLIPHKAISSGIESIVEVTGYSRSWRVLQFANYVFDVAVGDIFCTFKVGATLCMAPMDDLLTDLVGVINSMRVDRLDLTPTVARLIQPEQVPQIKTLCLAGEQVPADLVEAWTKHCQVINCYGPTEASILAAAGEIAQGGNSRIIGKPLKHCAGMLLEPNGTNLVPYGAVGELCLGGFQLAREYLNRVEATEKAFVTIDGERIYRTGDLASWTEDQRLECLGRKDSQIKINGHRIEIGEIESAILGTKMAADTVAVAVEIKNKTYLVAFCVIENAGDVVKEFVLDSAEHKETLTALSLGLSSLPPYMVPQYWIPVKTLPRMPSGKANRRKLISLVQAMEDSELLQYSAGDSQFASMVEPSTPEEFLLRSVWADMFGVEEETISATDAFFSYGGDSISAINLSGKCRGLGYALPVSDVMAFPLLQDMAGHMRSIEGKASLPEPPTLQMSEALSAQLTQKGLSADQIQDVWPCPPGVEEFLIRGAADSQFWQCQTVRPLPADFNWTEWIRLTTELTAANDILRTMWVIDNGSWIQIVLKEPVLDLDIVQCDSAEHRDEVVSQTWAKHFTIDDCKPFIRYRLFETPSTGEKHLLIKIHHAMYDGTLLRIFDGQFRALLNGVDLPEAVQFANYVGHMSAIPDKSTQKSVDFWVDLLKDAPAPYPSHPDREFVAQTTGMSIKSCDSRVDGFAAQCGVTVPIVFQSAFTVLLAELSGSAAVVYDNLITGRNIDMEGTQIINGNCANFLPFLGTVAPDATVRSLLKDTQDLFWKATDNGDVNMTRINRALGDADSARKSRSLFLFQPFEPVTGAQKHMRWMVMAGSKVTMPIDYALHIEVSKTVTGYNIKLKYDGTTYSPEEIDQVGDTYLAILDEMISRSFSTLASFGAVSLSI